MCQYGKSRIVYNFSLDDYLVLDTEFLDSN